MILALFSFLAVASAPIGEDLCSDANSTVEIVECVNVVYKLADSQMTYDWRRALVRMKKKDADFSKLKKQPQPTYAEALLDSQRKWLAFRDSHCRLEGFRMRGGSGQGYSAIICLTDLTNQRAAALRGIDF